jgi:hypothetical protein
VRLERGYGTVARRSRTADLLEPEETHNAIEATGRLPRRGTEPSVFEPGLERGSNRVAGRSPGERCLPFSLGLEW